MRKVDKINNMRKVNVLTEERQNDIRSITEIFGYTARKEAKSKQTDLETSFKEIDNINIVSYLIYQPGNKDSFKEKVKGMVYHLNELKEKLPTIVKIIPSMFNTEELNIAGINNKSITSETIASICPAGWFQILNGGNGMVDSKENIDNKLKIVIKNKLKF
jgi:hypothetical protein